MHLSFTKAVAPTILLAFFIYTTTLVDLSLQDGSDECEAKFDDAEKCFQSLMILGKNTQINKETFQALCQTEFDAISCIQDYKTKCVKGMASMVFNLLAKKFNSTFRNLCSNEPAMDGNSDLENRILHNPTNIYFFICQNSWGTSTASKSHSCQTGQSCARSSTIFVWR